MNAKQSKTLEDIFRNPIKSSVLWSDVEGLFKACGAHIEEGRGSRVCVLLNNVVAVFHRPHPQKETDKGALKAVRRFLANAGVKHDEI
ncbi:MAG: type II toxin-antitoxin system HicA family toxin [Treponema sp.]|nr:type II toxin-antitoxin system HicA family toxin [Treponema sp.]